MPRLSLIQKMTPKYKVAYSVSTGECLNQYLIIIQITISKVFPVGLKVENCLFAIRVGIGRSPVLVHKLVECIFVGILLATHEHLFGETNIISLYLNERFKSNIF